MLLTPFTLFFPNQNNFMAIILRLIYILLIILYPIGIFVGLKFFEPRILSLLFLGIIIFHFLSLKKDPNSPRLQKYSIIIIAFIIMVLVQIFNQILFIKIYPVAISLILLIAFSYTLLFPPSMVEKFARLHNKNLPEKAIQYTRKVTIIWCIFFIINGLISLYTAFVSSIEIWTLYNGLISYILMGTLFLGEYIVRHFVIKNE